MRKDLDASGKMSGDYRKLLTVAQNTFGKEVLPTLEDGACMLRLLARSATGQHFSNYTSFMSGPKRDGERDGPEEFHVVLVDNQRT